MIIFYPKTDHPSTWGSSCHWSFSSWHYSFFFLASFAFIFWLIFMENPQRWARLFYIFHWSGRSYRSVNVCTKSMCEFSLSSSTQEIQGEERNSPTEQMGPIEEST